ncbi:unnamed protein product [Ectocarpus sp. 8 AP-2014]
MALAGVTDDVHGEVESIVNLDSAPGNPVCGPSTENVIIVGGAGGKETESLQPVDDSDRHDGGAHSSDGTTDPIPAVISTTDAVANETEYLSEPARRWTKLRQNFRLAALRSIAQDKREALKKLQEVRKRADKAQEAQSDSRTCKICWDRATNTVCLDCGHQCMCTRCGACMTFCPICMQDITDLVELQ